MACPSGTDLPSLVRHLKRLLLVSVLLLALPALLIGGVYLWLKSMDPAELRDQLEAALEQATGREVSLAGLPVITLRPLPSVTLDQVTIANPAWARSAKMLSIRRLSIRPSLRRLLRGKVLLHEISVDGVQLWLENGPEGQPSWRLTPASSSSIDAPEIRIESIEATGIRVSYFDRQDGHTRSVTLAEISAMATGSDKPIEISVRGTIMDLPLAVSGTIGTPNQVQGGEPFSFTLDSALGRTHLELDGKLLDADFRDFDGLEVDFEGTGQRPVVLMAWTDLPIPKMDHFQLSGHLRGTGDRISLRQADARLGDDDYTVHITGDISDLTRLRGLALDFESSGKSPASFLPRLQGPWLATDKYTASGRLEGSIATLRLSALKIAATVKQTQLTLGGTVDDLAGAGQLDVLFGVHGEDIASVSSFIDLPIPDVDELDGTLRVTGSWDDIRAGAIEAQLREGSVTGRLSGHIGHLPDLSDMELRLVADGTDLRDLQSLIGVEDLPQTDTVSGVVVLSGRQRDMSLHIDSLKMTRDDLRLAATGWLQNLTGIPRIDLKLDLQGRNISDIEYFAGLTVPPSDHFKASGRLRGRAAEPDLEELTATARLGAIQIDITSGHLPNVMDSKRFEVHTQIKGDDLSRIGDVYDQTWPVTTGFTVDTKASGTWEHPRLTDLTGKLVTPDVDMQVSGRIGDLIEARDVYLDIQASAQTLVPLLPWGGRAWERLGAADTSFTLSGGPEHFEFDLEHLSAGRTQLQGRFDATFNDGDLGRLHGDLVSSSLDLTPWLKPESDTDTASAPSGGRSGEALVFPHTPLPLDWMQGRDFDIGLANLQLFLGETQLGVETGRLEVERNVMKIDPFSVDYGEDRITGLVVLDAASEPASLKAVMRSVDFDLGRLAQRMGVSRQARGKVDLLLNLDTQGATPRAMANQADGRFALLLREGYFDARVASLGAVQALTRLLPWTRHENGTQVSCAMADFAIAKGVASSHLLVLDTESMLMRGTGEIDLGQERYDLLLRPRPKQGRAMGFNANVRVTGPLSAPRFRIQTRETATKAAGAVGRFAVLGPLGLFVSTDSFRSTRQECATSMEEVESLR